MAGLKKFDQGDKVPPLNHPESVLLTQAILAAAAAGDHAAAARLGALARDPATLRAVVRAGMLRGRARHR